MSIDGEVEAAYRRDGMRLIGAARVFGNGYADGAALAAVGVVVFHPWRGRAPIALAADLGALLGEDREPLN